MNKVSGTLEDFAYFREDASRSIIGYGLNKPEGNEFYEWYEVYIYKTQNTNISLQVVKDAILNDINARTDERILNGLVWNGTKVWLSSENQFNYKAAYDLALQSQGQSLPVTFKIGETEDGTPIYHVFSEMQDFTDFYTTVFAYINQCLNEGWQEKDAIDWQPYEELFPEPEQQDVVNE